MNINIEQQLKVILGKSLDEASKEEIYIALLNFTKKQLQQMKRNSGDRKLYYISAEFLVGKLLSNNLINLGIFEEVRDVLKNHGHNLTEIEEMEMEPSLGNGGLGPVSYTHLVEMDLGKPFERITMVDAVKKYAGVDWNEVKTLKEARELAKEHHVEYEERHKKGDILSLFFEEFAEEHLIQPTFVTDHPIEISPCLLYTSVYGRRQI